MKTLKILNDISKIALEKKGGYYYDYDGEYYYFTDSKVVYVLEDMECLIDIDKVDQLGIKKRNICDLIFKENDKLQPIMLSGIRVEESRFTAVELKRDNVSIYVDAKYLKYFVSPTFKVNKNGLFIYVYEFDILKGVICPIRLNKG